MSPEGTRVREDIQRTLGAVPEWLAEYPAEALSSAWTTMKSIEFNPRTALPSKYKELIALAVATQTGCTNCISYHTQAAEAAGAKRQEIGEAIGMASMTRHWSTILNGAEIDEKEFKTQADEIMRHTGKAMEQPADRTRPGETGRAGETGRTGETTRTMEVTDAESAYRDIKDVLGQVPSFLRAYPEEAIAPAWNHMKALQFSNTTAIPPKYKELIGLAVASQIPCRYCVYFHTKAAAQQGAAEREVHETLAMAGIARHWATWISGLMIPEDRFNRDTAKMIRHMRTQRPPAS